MLLSKSSCKQLPEPAYKVHEFSPNFALNPHIYTYQSILSLYQKSISESSMAYIDNKLLILQQIPNENDFVFLMRPFTICD